MKSLLRRLGLELHRYSAASSDDARRLRILEGAGIDVALDVGANVGQYATGLRQSGFRGRIVSFEPQSAQFARLQAAAAADPRWECRRLALGSEEGSAELRIGGSTETSSLLEVEQHLAEVPEWRTAGTETVPVARLDALAPELLRDGERVLLKIDVQGYELEVLRGATEMLGAVHALEIELLLVPLYRDQASYLETLEHLDAAGFRLASVSPGYVHAPSGHMVYLDGLLVRKSG